jgi:voltage-gated potassium channel Kch
MTLEPSGIMCAAIRTGNIILESIQELFPEGEILGRSDGSNMKTTVMAGSDFHDSARY